jgi:hypothetical protein
MIRITQQRELLSVLCRTIIVRYNFQRYEEVIEREQHGRHAEIRQTTAQKQEPEMRRQQHRGGKGRQA